MTRTHSMDHDQKLHQTVVDVTRGGGLQNEDFMAQGVSKYT